MTARHTLERLREVDAELVLAPRVQAEAEQRERDLWLHGQRSPITLSEPLDP